MPSMYDSHGDVLAIKIHKNNSLEWMKPQRRSRPSSAMPKPRPPIPNIPGLAPPKRRPQSAAARFQTGPPKLNFPNGKSLAQKTIDGEYGPAMSGVTTYPYSRNQQLYLADFRCLVANTITHPFMATTGFNVGSVPHDLLAGSNFDDDKMGGFERKWRSECRNAYTKKSIVESKTASACGVRSEQVQ